MGWDSSGGIETCYGLDGLGIETQWGARFFRNRPDWPLCPPNLLHDGYKSLSSGIKRPGRGVDHTPESGAKVKERPS
jgi:hypothetical protein